MVSFERHGYKRPGRAHGDSQHCRRHPLLKSSGFGKRFEFFCDCLGGDAEKAMAVNGRSAGAGGA